MKGSDKVAVGGFAVLGVAVFAGVGYLSYQAETETDKPTWIREQENRAEAQRRGAEAASRDAALSIMRQSFAPWVDQWLEWGDLKTAPPGQEVKGKAVVLDKVTRSVDALQLQLPATIQAKSADEAKVVVWLEWGRGESVRVASGDTGWPSTCNVTVIDPKRRLIVATHLIQGVPPPSRKRIRDSFEPQGPKPSGGVVNFLTSRIRPPG